MGGGGGRIAQSIPAPHPAALGLNLSFGQLFSYSDVAELIDLLYSAYKVYTENLIYIVYQALLVLVSGKPVL